MVVKNHFKGHSADAVEQCIAKALSELLGKDVTVEIGELKFSSDASALDKSVTFSVQARHEGWRPEMMGV